MNASRSFLDGYANRVGLTVIHLPPQPGFPAPNASDKKFNSRPVAPTIFLEKPFGENVEGLSHCGDRSYSSTSVFNSHGAIE